MAEKKVMRFEILTVTPEMADKWLGKNEGNRKLREQRAAHLARAIQDGKYRLTHQAIAFSNKGRLLDGQHRLRAVVLSQMPIETVVAFDVPETAFEVMDAGLPRKMYERLRSDPKNTSVATTAFRLLLAARNAHEYETALIMEIFGPALVKLEQVSKPRTRHRIGKSTQEAAIVLRMALAIKDHDEQEQERINWLLGKLRHGDMAGAPSIALAYYKFLLEGPSHQVAVSRETDEFARAWVAFDPEKEALIKLQITDHSKVMREARDVFKDVSAGVFDE